MERNIYKIGKELFITSNETPDEGDWFLGLQNQILKATDKDIYGGYERKIILTTDPDLIKDGVQAINDEVLEWFIKNPNCREIEVVDVRSLGVYGSYYPYKIIIPKEDTKQETLEEAAKREYESRKFRSDFPFDSQSFKLGAKWQQERNYSEEEVKNLVKIIEWYDEASDVRPDYKPNIEERIGDLTMWKWFEQFKKQ